MQQDKQVINQVDSEQKTSPKKTRFMPKKAKAKPLAAQYIRVNCPNCGGSMRTIYSKQVTNDTSDRRMVCRNDDCMAVYKVQVSCYDVMREPLNMGADTPDLF